MSVWIVSASLIVGLIGAGGLSSVIVERMRLNATAASGSRENVMIDQYQERVKEQNERIGVLEARADASALREQIRDDYIMALRQHIAAGKPPPPPPWPAHLTTP